MNLSIKSLCPGDCSAGTQYSKNVRWVFPQRCNVSDIQGTFREHFKRKYFLINSRWISCLCVKNVWFDKNKCWSFGKFQQSQSNICRIFEEHSTNFCFKNIPSIFPGILYGYIVRNIVFMKSKSVKIWFMGYPVKFLILVGSLPSWNVFPNFIETVFHLE